MIEIEVDAQLKATLVRNPQDHPAVLLEQVVVGSRLALPDRKLHRTVTEFLQDGAPETDAYRELVFRCSIAGRDWIGVVRRIERVRSRSGPAKDSSVGVVRVTPIRADGSHVGPRLRTLFGLTEAESRIVKAFATGASPAEIAASNRTSVLTVRNQLRAALHKMGLKRAAEIAACVARLEML